MAVCKGTELGGSWAAQGPAQAADTAEGSTMLKAERRLLRLGLHNPPSGTGLGKALEKALGAPPAAG